MNWYEYEREIMDDFEKKLNEKDNFTLSDSFTDSDSIMDEYRPSNDMPWHVLETFGRDGAKELVGKTITIPLSLYLKELYFLGNLRDRLIYYIDSLSTPYEEIENRDVIESLEDDIAEQMDILQNYEAASGPPYRKKLPCENRNRSTH